MRQLNLRLRNFDRGFSHVKLYIRGIKGGKGSKQKCQLGFGGILLPVGLTERSLRNIVVIASGARAKRYNQI